MPIPERALELVFQEGRSISIKKEAVLTESAS
jgi:hypothetical protein